MPKIWNRECLCSTTTTVKSERTLPNLWMWISYIFIALEINKQINKLCWNMCRLWRNVYIQYIYTLQVHMYTTGIVIHYIGWGCRSPNAKEILWFKWELCVRYVWLFQERSPGIKQDLPVQPIMSVSNAQHCPCGWWKATVCKWLINYWNYSLFSITYDDLPTILWRVF